MLGLMGLGALVILYALGQWFGEYDGALVLHS